MAASFPDLDPQRCRRVFQSVGHRVPDDLGTGPALGADERLDRAAPLFVQRSDRPRAPR